MRETDANVKELLAGVPPAVARRDAELLLASVIGGTRAWLLAHPEAAVRGDDAVRFHALVQRRVAREPLQYLLGEQEFFGLALRVTPDTLIPRPETEHLVEAVLVWAAERADPERTEHPLRFADVGTGSGAIAIALACSLAGVEIAATDISPGALRVARQNAVAHGCAACIRFIEGDLLAGESGLDAVVSNPPYVPQADRETLEPEVVAHEPHAALFGGADGLDVYRRLLPEARAALRPDGLLALEFGFGQRDALAALLADWKDVRFLDDYAGIPRVALALR